MGGKQIQEGTYLLWQSPKSVKCNSLKHIYIILEYIFNAILIYKPENRKVIPIAGQGAILIDDLSMKIQN